MVTIGCDGMSQEIQKLVDTLELKQKKEQMIRDQKRIFRVKSIMSQLTFDIEVAKYAALLDDSEYYSAFIKRGKGTDKQLREAHEYLKIVNARIGITKLTSKKADYLRYRQEYQKLTRRHPYYWTLQRSFRVGLMNIGTPAIFVEQKEQDINIVNPNEVRESTATVVTPPYDMDSTRDYRHFYNRTSFRYLDSLVEDPTYELEGKNIGKVKVLTR